MKNLLIKYKESRMASRLVPIVFLIFLAIIFSLQTQGRFSDLKNIRLVLEQAMITATVATGGVFIFSTGNVNIAMGASTALIATLSALIYLSTGSVLLMFAAAIILGVILMVISALLSTAFRVSVLFVTVVMMTLLATIQRTIIGGSTITLPYAMTSGLKNDGVPYIIFGVFFVICLILFEFTSLGRKLKFLGTNRICAAQSGLKMGNLFIVASLIAGVGVGAGALLTIIRSGTVAISTASSLNMDAMLAIVLGGMSVFGGSRSFVYSGVIGAVIVTVLNNGLLMLGVDATILQGIRGVLFLILVTTSQKRTKGLPAPEYV